MEDQIKQLETKLTFLKENNEFEVTQSAVQAKQMSMLSTLRSIREAMVSKDNGGGTTGGISSSREVEALKEENKKLKIANDKQRYRIELLVGNLKRATPDVIDV
eukprot:CAMPEP_0198259422 /NCGR_PEP_ID=MMETSP1447-20131203/8629_1 /TAXON_ID=420782 /ORGANISM="Chaetoceros dichaeta, Strain CCMP1751" /LENGTH=103 /DNA_ID=CAMNT_0043946811 /DNA_START=58 /DNA_END=369 /DNA_ORIENTATION=-